MNFSTLPGWKTISIKERPTRVSVRAVLTTEPHQCRHCLASPDSLQLYGKRTRAVKDSPVGGKPVEISLTRRRYLCGVCHRTSMQPMPGVDERRRATIRLIEMAAQRALRRPFWLVACETGLSARAVRHAFSAEVNRLDRLASCEAPRVLGFDFIHIGRHRGLLLTDIEARRVINLAAGEGQRETSRALSELRNGWRVETVMLPFSRSVRQIVRWMLPQARVIVDCFLVMSRVLDAIDAVRKNHSPSQCPVARCELETAYALKARFMDVWRSRSRATARRRYSEWVLSVPQELDYAFGPVMQMVEDWSDEIFGYFDQHTSGAYPQSVIHRIRTMQRSGQCREFPTARAKIVYGTACG